MKSGKKCSGLVEMSRREKKMTKELEDALYKDFPELFQEVELDMTQTCMCWGLECGDGWEPVVRNMCKMLSAKVRQKSIIRRKPPFPYAFKLQALLASKTRGLCRWLEKKLDKPFWSLSVPEPQRYEQFPGWGVKFTQIKQKFGLLRVYHTVYPKFEEKDVKNFTLESIEAAHERFCGYVNGLIDAAEYMSGQTCEKDGTPGKLYTQGWWHTSCDACENLKKERKTKAENEQQDIL